MTSTHADWAPVAPSVWPQRSRRGKVLVALAVGLVVIAATVAAVWLLWTWRHPQVFPVIDAGYTMSAQTRRRRGPCTTA